MLGVEWRERSPKSWSFPKAEVWLEWIEGEEEKEFFLKSASFPGVWDAKTKFSISLSTDAASVSSPDSDDNMIPKECGCSQMPQWVCQSTSGINCFPKLPAGGARVSKFMNFPFTWLLLWGISVNSLLLLAVSSSHNPYMAPPDSNNHKGTRSIFKTHFVPFKMC